MIKKSFTFSLRGQLRTQDFPCVMGILNLTPDSFHPGSRIHNEGELIIKAEEMVRDGAAILDLGAVSTRPGADLLSQEQEMSRLLPNLKTIRKRFPDELLSVDTFRASVAEAAAIEGADIINDISGGTMDDKMFETIANARLPYILMHIRSTPENMQQHTNYNDIITDISFFFANQIKKATQNGVHDIIIDPGFGFAKTIDQNFELLQKFELLHIHNKPLLAGLSRKSLIFKTLETTTEHALNGTTTLNTIALMKGAHILRVHDVKQAIEAIKLVDKVMSANQKK
jgi:dihydropteroate synthase